MKKNLLVIIILTIAIVAGIYNLHEVKDETIQMQSTLQQSAIPQIVPVRPDVPKDWPTNRNKYGGDIGIGFTVNGKEFHISQDIIVRYDKCWIDSSKIPQVVAVLKNKEAMRDKARIIYSDTPTATGLDVYKNAFDWSSPVIYKGVKLSEFQIWMDGKMYCPLEEVLAVEGYPVTYSLINKFASTEYDKMEKEWLKRTGIDRAMTYIKYSEDGKYRLNDFTQYPLAKELFKPQYIYDMVKGKVEERGDLGYFSNAIAGNKQTLLYSNNAERDDIFIKLDTKLLSEKIPYTASSNVEGYEYGYVHMGVTKAGEEIYYFGTTAKKITQGKYKGWEWIPNSNVIYTPTDMHKQDGMTFWNDWVELLLLPVGTKITVENDYVGSADVQVTITNQVFKPLWDINNQPK